MMLKSNVQQNDYIGTLFDSYVSTILQSGLLLDEDLEILVNHYKSDGLLRFPEYRPSVKLKSSIAILFGSLLLAKKCGSMWLVIPSAVLTAVSTVLEMRDVQVKKNQKLFIENIIKVYKKINSLNSSIRKYMRTRAEVENKSQEHLFKGYNKSIEEFMSKLYENELIFFKNVMIYAEVFAKLSVNLMDDFSSIKNFKPLLEETPKFDDIIACNTILAQIQDIHIWLTSKLLSYMGVIFFSSNLLNNNSTYSILNETLPNLLSFLMQNYESSRKLFYNLRNSVIKLDEYKSQKPKPQISNKLQNTLLSAVDNISIISEKSHQILEKIEYSNDRCSPELESALLDLKNHTYAAYESLDLLCRLYGILSSQNIPSTKKEVNIKEIKNSNKHNVITVHHDDNVDPVEENFELYLDKDFIPDEEPKTYVDDSGAYLNLMLQELRQSLRKHERFVEAKKRRGSVEEEKIEKEEMDLPKFDLDALNTDRKIIDKQIETCDDQSVGSPVSVEKPKEFNSSLAKEIVSPIGTSQSADSFPPPPPPLPDKSEDFNLTFLAEEVNSVGRSKSMFDNIKTLSNQLNRHEEVFGECADEDEECA